MGRKLGAMPPFWGELDPHLTVAGDEAYLHTKWHLNPSRCLATTDMGRKLVGYYYALLGELCPHLTQCRLG